MTLRIRLCYLLLAFLACLPVAACAGASQYQIAGLGSLGGFTQITPQAINDNGQIVGHMLTQDNQLHGFLWQNDQFTDLGSGSATQINRGGQILVNNLTESFLWDNGALLPLGELTSEDNQADAVNDNGDVVGEVTNQGPLNGVYLWQNGETDRLPLQWPVSKQHGSSWKTSNEEINDQGAVIGRAVPPGSELQYVYLYQNGKTTLILPAGASNAWPTAINNQGWVLGEAKVTNKSIIYAFLWRNGKVTPLGPTSEDSNTSAVALNDQGEVIVSVNVTTITNRIDANVTSYPYLWQNGVRYDLKKLIVNGTGWTNLNVTAMNDSGEIVGVAEFHGSVRGFLLRPI